MDLHPEERSYAPFHPVSDAVLLELVGRPRLVLVDGRSGSGKTTFAATLAEKLGAQVVHTDDVAWNHAPLDWEDVLVPGVLAPWLAGERVELRPPAWERHGRDGAIVVEPGGSLVVEGVGAGRESLATHADLVVWVQSDRTTARTRGIERDASYGTRTHEEAVAFWDDYLRSEEPHLAADRPWERAGLVVLGTPPGPGTWVVSPGS